MAPIIMMARIAMLPDKKTIVVISDSDFGIAIDIKNNENKDVEATDYTLYADGSLKYNEMLVKPAFRIVPNSKVERNTHLWLVKLPEALK